MDEEEQDMKSAAISEPVVVQINVNAEVDRYFDDSSLSQGNPPRLLIFMGGPASGKTTLRREKCSQGYVLVDAAEIFISLSGDAYYDFPDDLEEPMMVIGHLVASRAIHERRHIVTELIGADFEATMELIDAMKAIGYKVEAVGVICDVEEAMKRNLARGEDNISCYYAEPYQRAWLLQAAREQAREF
jgi:chloramphenicol 3-O-phosphotransferase